MAIERWEPFREMVSLREVMNSQLAENFVRPSGPPAPGGTARLPLEVAETEGDFVIKASLPGLLSEDVHITAHGDTLTIRGEHNAEEERKHMHWHLRERRVSLITRSISLGTPRARPTRPTRGFTTVCPSSSVHRISLRRSFKRCQGTKQGITSDAESIEWSPRSSRQQASLMG